MKSWNVYSSGRTGYVADSVIATAYELEYHGEYMGEVYLSATFNSEKPIKFNIGDYIEYRGERFYLSVVPACKQQASRGSYGQAFVYENVKFNSVANELATCNFLDVVLDDNKIHWTALPTFTFHCRNVKDLADRIQANLDRVYGEGTWYIKVGECEDYEEEISIDKQTVWDALALVDTTFHKNFIIRERNIFIYPDFEESIAHTFKVGVGNGLISIEQNVDDQQKVVTRLRAYGNTTNIPTSYYKYVTMKGVVNFVAKNYGNTILRVPTIGIQGYEGVYSHTTIIMPTDIWAGNAASYNRIGDKSILIKKTTTKTTHEIDKESAHPQIRVNFGDEKYGYYETNAYVYYWKNTEEEKIIAWEFVDKTWQSNSFNEYLSAKTGSYYNSNLKEDITLYSDNSDVINFSNLIKHFGDNVLSDVFPNNMAVTRLMLPEFPSLSDVEKDLGYISSEYKGYKLIVSGSDVYIDSPNIEKYGIVEGDLYIDGTDNEYTRKDIYPSLEGFTADDLINAGYNIRIEHGLDRNMDRIASGSCLVSGKDLDNGDPDFSVQGSQCYVWIKDIGFDINNYLIQGETPALHMRSGMCSGRDFDIASVVDTSSPGGRYRLTINRKLDENLNLYFPNKDFNIEYGDEFSILNIKMPKVYYDVASQKLLKEALKWFVHNDETIFTFTPTMDNVWLARNDRETHKKYGQNAKTIYSTIQAGDLMMIESDDLGIGTSVRISSLTIREKSNAIPEFEVQLQDKKSVGTIQRIQSKLEDYTSSGGGGLSYDQVKSVISDSGKFKFISKRDDDFAEGQITLEKGLVAQSSHNGSETAADGLIEYFKEEE